MPIACPDNSSGPTASPSATDREAAWFVWGVWAILLASALAFIWTFGRNLPSGDEWELVPAITGHEAVNLPYLWSPHNEHRILVPRLVYLGLAKLTHGDFRAGMYCNGLILGALAAFLIGAARRLRGRTNYTDAVFPLALLHLGHADTLLFSFQIQFTLSALLVVGLLGVILRSHQRLTGRAGLAAGLCLILLPLCGANGLPFVPTLAAWLVYWAWGDRQAPGGVRRLVLVVSAAAVALALVGTYFIDLSHAVSHPARPSFPAFIRVAGQFLAMSGGPAVAPYWPYSGYVIAGLVVFALVVLLRTGLGQPRARVRTLGLLALFAAMLGLAGEVAFGRSGGDPGTGGLWGRYAVLAAPLVCLMYFAVEIRAAPALACFGQMALFTLLVGLTLPNVESGLWQARYKRDLLAPCEQDLRAHVPIPMIAQRNPGLYPWMPGQLVPWFDMLRQADMGPFKFLPPVAGDAGGSTPRARAGVPSDVVAGKNPP